MTAPPADLDALARASNILTTLGASLDDTALAGSTPCSEWTVGDLLDHVVGGNIFTIEILAGASADDAMATTMSTFGDGYDRCRTLVETTRTQQAVFAADGALDGHYQHITGELAGRDVLRARLHDLIIHSWDLAEAMQPPARIEDDLVAWACAELASNGSVTAEHFGVDASTISDSASLLTAFGRAPRR